MSNLENLTAKILADGEKKAKTIVDNAKRDGESLIAKAEAEANAEGVKAIAAAEDEAKKLIELALSAKKIEIRDKGLAAKQSTIAKALDAAKQKLSGMDQNAYEGFLWRYLNETSFSAGETLRVPEKYAGLDMDALNKKLTAAGKPALALDKTRFAESGFKLVKNDIENDNSFDALIDYYRESLEQTVVESLF